MVVIIDNVIEEDVSMARNNEIIHNNLKEGQLLERVYTSYHNEDSNRFMNKFRMQKHIKKDNLKSIKLEKKRNQANINSNVNGVPTFNVVVHKKIFKLPTPWISISNTGEVMISKNKLKKLMKISFIAGNVVTGSVVLLANSGLNALKLQQGTEYIVENFSNNGLVPNGLSSRLVNGNLELLYVDANGQTQVVSGESVDYLVEEMTETTVANGWDISALAVYLDKICGENAPAIPNVTESGMNKARMDAYELKEFEEKKEEYANKGVAR